MSKAGEKQNNRSGVLICGAYGLGNAGDDAILEAIVHQMRTIDPDMPITVLSRRPEEPGARYGVKAILLPFSGLFKGYEDDEGISQRGRQPYTGCNRPPQPVVLSVYPSRREKTGQQGHYVRLRNWPRKQAV